MKTNALYTAAIMAQLCSSTPIEAAMSKTEVATVARTANLVDMALLQTCKAQSCYLADASGSSGKDPTIMPEGANDEDLKCIFKYNKRAEKVLGDYKKAGTTIPNVPKQDTGVSTSLFKGINNLQRPNERKKGETDTGKFTGKCTPNIMIFSKGTLEPTQYGITVGQTFTTGWDSTWSTNPVIYDPTVSGDFCLGLPGGMVARDLINQAAAKCPKSNLYLSGYSQGAMVVRNGVAYANDSAKKRVKGVITFGDPFNGAPIKGYTGAIKTYCKPTDGVCGGNFELSTAHVAYPFDSTVNDAKAYLKQLAASQK